MLNFDKCKELLVKAMNLALELNLAGDPLDGEACRAAFKAAKSIAETLVDSYGSDVLFSDDVLSGMTDCDTAREVLEDHFGPIEATETVERNDILEALGVDNLSDETLADWWETYIDPDGCSAIDMDPDVELEGYLQTQTGPEKADSPVWSLAWQEGFKLACKAWCKYHAECHQLEDELEAHNNGGE
jgi:hypothetical protein